MKKLLGACVMVSLALFVHNSCGGGGGAGGADTQAPTNVTITSGITPGQVVSGIVRLTATAQDNSGSIQKIEFYVSTNPVLACTAQGPKPSGQSFSCDWNSTTVANGPHTLTARAYDPAGNTADSQGINFTVNNWNLADLYSTLYSSVKYTNLVKAPNGQLHLAFYDGTQGPMWAFSSDSIPSNLGEPSPIEIADNRNGNYGLDLSFAVSADNEPSAGYSFSGTSRLPTYASYHQGQWLHYHGLGPFTDAGYHTSLARSRISGEGDDLLVYANFIDHEYIATLTHCTPDACDLPKHLGEPGLAYSVLPLGGNADPVLIFYLTPGTNSSLRMIVCSRMNCPGSPSPVTIGTGLGTVDLNTPPVRSVIIGQTAWVVVAGSSPSSFKCAASSSSAIPTECLNPANWTREQISTDTATWLSLAVNSSTNLPIVAYTTSSGELKYAAYNVGWGTPETVASGLASGSGYPAITHYTVNSTGVVAIVFFDAGTGRIRIATRSG